MLWAVTAGVLLVSFIMILRAVLTVGTLRAVATGLLSMALMTVAMVLVAEMGIANLSLPTYGPSMMLALAAEPRYLDFLQFSRPKIGIIRPFPPHKKQHAGKAGGQCGPSGARTH